MRAVIPSTRPSPVAARAALVLAVLGLLGGVAVAEPAFRDEPPNPDDRVAFDWRTLAREGVGFTPGRGAVRYGAGASWVEKRFESGSGQVCSNATFGGDPAPGVVKSCQIRIAAADAAGMTPRPMGMTMAHGDHAGPVIDRSKIPPPTTLDDWTGNRWDKSERQLNVADKRKPVPLVSPDVPVPAYTPVHSDIGSFRTVCFYSHMSFDDPLVFPTRPGVSHLHVFFGGHNTDSKLRAGNVRDAAALASGSTCAGGTLNMSRYWAPAVIDTRSHAPVKPNILLVYYKTGYMLPAESMEELPTGLVYIAGDASNVDPEAGAQSTRYSCARPNVPGDSGWHSDFAKVVATGFCKAGGEFTMSVDFPQCWDGINLDSPTHNAHVAGAINNGHGYACPRSHPHPLTAPGFVIRYPIGDDDAVANWRLSSDRYDPALPAGLSGHADYMFGWDQKTMRDWLVNCDRKRMDCHADLLGDMSFLSF